MTDYSDWPDGPDLAYALGHNQARDHLLVVVTEPLPTRPGEREDFLADHLHHLAHACWTSHRWAGTGTDGQCEPPRCLEGEASDHWAIHSAGHDYLGRLGVGRSFGLRVAVLDPGRTGVTVLLGHRFDPTYREGVAGILMVAADCITLGHTFDTGALN